MELGLSPLSKVCSRCRKRKPVGDFCLDRTSTARHKIRAYCNDCHRKQQADWAANNPDAVKKITRRTQTLARYGVTPEEYDELLVAQGGRCAICGALPKTRRLNFDHAHRGLHLRGLLCHACNQGLGYFYDDPQRLQSAIEYLADPPAQRKWPGRTAPKNGRRHWTVPVASKK